MKKIILLFCLLMLMGIVTAATDTNNADDIFKINTPINYIKPCINNGTYCGATATCNYTFFHPDGIPLVNNKLATQYNAGSGAYFNYSVTFTKVGVHQIDMTCNDVGRTGAETLYADVTGSGFNNTLGFYFLILGISAAIMALGFSIKDGWIVILGTFGVYFIALYILFNGIVGVKDLVTTFAIGIILLGVAGYISVKSGLEMIGE